MIHKMDTTKKFSELFGLSTQESKIYIALAQKGPSLIAQLSKHSHIPRTALYTPVKHLLQKGFISESTFGKRTYYTAIPAENLRLLFEERKHSLEQVLTELNQKNSLQVHDAGLDVTLYPGSEGIKSAGLIFMNETVEKKWCSFENISLVTDTVGIDFEEFYIKERVKRKIHSNVILTMTEESPAIRKLLQADKEHLRETILLSPNEYPFANTIVATKGLVLLINPSMNQFALLIRNDALAKTFINIHRTIWDRYR